MNITGRRERDLGRRLYIFNTWVWGSQDTYLWTPSGLWSEFFWEPIQHSVVLCIVKTTNLTVSTMVYMKLGKNYKRQVISIKKATWQSYIFWLYLFVCLLFFWRSNPGPREHKHKPSPTKGHPAFPSQRAILHWKHMSVLISGLFFFLKRSQNLFFNISFPLFYIYST